MKQVFCAFPPAHTLPQPPTNNQQQASSAQTFLRQTFHPSGSVSPDGRHDALHRRVPASGHPLSPTPPELVEESPARGGREAAVVHLLPRRSSSPPQLRRTRSRAVVSHPCSLLPLRAALAARGYCCGVAAALNEHTAVSFQLRVDREESQHTSAACLRHKNMKKARPPPKHRRRSKAAMPTRTKNLIVQLVLQKCTLTAPELRSEVAFQLGETWSSSACAKVRTGAGFRRKRTVATKREACPIQQHCHAQQPADNAALLGFVESGKGQQGTDRRAPLTGSSTWDTTASTSSS